MTTLTKVTNSVIAANAVQSVHIANSAVDNRQLATASVTLDKLGANANISSISSNVNLVQSNLTALLSTFDGRDINASNTFGVGGGVKVVLVDNTAKTLGFTGTNVSITGNSIISGFLEVYTAPTTTSRVGNVAYSDSRYYANDHASYLVLMNNVGIVQANLSAFIAGGVPITGDLLVQGDLTIEGNTFQANVGTITSEDKNIILNSGGSNATALGGGIIISGTSNVSLVNLIYTTDSVSNLRIGIPGSFTSGDDVARFKDFQANDGVTVLVAYANDFATLNSARANDLATYNQLTLDFRANDYNTYTSLNANINSVQSNLTALSGTLLYPYTNTTTASGTTNVFIIGGSNTAESINVVFTSISGVHQPKTGFVFHSGNNSIQFNDSVIPAGEVVETTAWITI